MKYGFIQRHGHRHPIERMCRVLGVSRSGYYGWRARVAREERGSGLHYCIIFESHRAKNRGQVIAMKQSREKYGQTRIIHKSLLASTSFDDNSLRF